MINDIMKKRMNSVSLQTILEKTKNVRDYKALRLGIIKKEILKVNYFNLQKGHSNKMSRGV